MDIDVKLSPARAPRSRPEVCVMVDELRASSVITTAFDAGCGMYLLTQSLAEARRLARMHDAVLVGERRGHTPRGFDVNNSPGALAAFGVAGRTVVHSTSNGTKALGRLQAMPAVLVGCLLNARAVAEAAIELAREHAVGVRIACAGEFGRFALDDAVAAGVIVERLIEALEARDEAASPTDEARAAIRLGSTYPSLEAALADSVSGRLVEALGFDEDVAFCARVDVSSTVPILRPGRPLRVEALR